MTVYREIEPEANTSRRNSPWRLLPVKVTEELEGILLRRSHNGKDGSPVDSS